MEVGQKTLKVIFADTGQGPNVDFRIQQLYIKPWD